MEIKESQKKPKKQNQTKDATEKPKERIKKEDKDVIEKPKGVTKKNRMATKMLKLIIVIIMYNNAKKYLT